MSITDARSLTIELVRAGSVTNSSGERDFAGVLHGIISREAYFQAHPDRVQTLPIPLDPFGRSNVLAFVRGQGARTVVLTGHYDVVDVANYGPLTPWAFEPEALRERIIADLRANARSEAEHRALLDLESGAFLPGRGVLDMKSGLAAGLVALYRFARLEQPVGNVVFLAVADEEVQSHGARAAVAQLEALAQDERLEIEAVINLDATADDGDGADGRALYTGSVGKLLVSAYVAGADTHAGYPFSGVNPAFLLAEVVRRVECNPRLADRSREHGVGAEAAPPPTTLEMTDLKAHYDVTTPGRAWAHWNVLTHGKPARDVLEDFRLEAQAALTSALETLRERASAWGATASGALAVQPFALSFEELMAKATARVPDLETELAAFTASLDAHLDAPTVSQRVTDFVWSRSELLGPAMVLGFGSLHYPAVALEGRDEREVRVLGRMRAALERAAQESGVVVRERGFFAGISDMSWFGVTPSREAGDLGFVNANTPDVRAHITAPPLGVPTVNLGPWGRDYHQWLERAHERYSFVELPELVWRVTTALLEDGGSSG